MERIITVKVPDGALKGLVDENGNPNLMWKNIIDPVQEDLKNQLESSGYISSDDLLNFSFIEDAAVDPDSYKRCIEITDVYGDDVEPSSVVLILEVEGIDRSN